MQNEDEKFVIDLAKLFPEAFRRVKILEDLKGSWFQIVGALAKNSYPCNLGVDEICIRVNNRQALYKLSSMKGNITRALKLRYNYKISENFKVKIEG